MATQSEHDSLRMHIPILTILAAFGLIERFHAAKKLVGYVRLDTRVHDSGQVHQNGRITTAGRKDLRAVIAESAHTAANTHPRWKAELARLEPRLDITRPSSPSHASCWLSSGCAQRTSR
jgi:transposase